jgi:hypothetical protein
MSISYEPQARLYRSFRLSRVLTQVSRGLLIGGILLGGIGGGFAPWIWRESVALQLTAPGLAEFIKFLPEVRLGQLQIERLYFLLPLFWAMLTLPLFIENRGLMLPRWLRWAGRLATIPLALASLSPVWTPAILRAPEFRLQTLLAGCALGLALVAPLLRRLPLKILILGSCLGGIIAIILPVWQFSLIQMPLMDVYRGPVALGWGWWLTVSGMVISLLGGVGTAFSHWGSQEKSNDDSRSTSDRN